MRKKGFTLIEMTVTVIPVGILAAIAIPKYNAAVEQSHLKEGVYLARALYASYVSYCEEHGRKPASLDDLSVKIPAGRAKYFDSMSLSSCGRQADATPYQQCTYLFVVYRSSGGPFGQYQLKVKPKGTVGCYADTAAVCTDKLHLPWYSDAE
jgi:prepilin-type N-terminal cleavage/methylation domain-containing protein